MKFTVLLQNRLMVVQKSFILVQKLLDAGAKQLPQARDGKAPR
jgi:hypothetical protein